jgi:transposase
MQLLLPIFPAGIKLISPLIGVKEGTDGMVHYFMNSLPIRTHLKEDLRAFRCFTASLICNHLCKQTEIQQCFGVSADSVQRSVKLYRQKGEAGFYERDGKYGKGGRTPKIIGEKKQRIQHKLNLGKSVNSIAREEGLRESAIRAAIQRGDLKKTPAENLMKLHSPSNAI